MVASLTFRTDAYWALQWRSPAFSCVRVCAFERERNWEWGAEGEGVRNPGRLCAECGVWHTTPFHDPESMIWAETDSDAQPAVPPRHLEDSRASAAAALTIERKTRSHERPLRVQAPSKGSRFPICIQFVLVLLHSLFIFLTTCPDDASLAPSTKAITINC